MSETDTDNLKASFRHNPKNYKSIYPKSSAALLISVGQKYHEGEKFAATIDLINRSNFKNLAIVIGDSNQKYNFSITSDEQLDKLHKKAIGLGTAWLDKNKQYYSQLTVPYKIMRWDEWLQHNEYSKTAHTLTCCMRMTLM